MMNQNQSVSVRIPGTCGEWIQTVRGGQECLVSLPIDRYTDARVYYTDESQAKASQLALLPKSRRALALIQNHLELSAAQMSRIAISQTRQLEIGKGMASSTADLLSVFIGVSTLTGHQLTPDTLLRLCCQIEASDGIMFDQWTLVDHLGGSVLKHFETYLPADILMVTPQTTFITERLREKPEYSTLLANKTSEPLRLFEKAMAEKSLELLGKAATLSLIENEWVLKKAHLEAMIELSEKHHCYGVVGGHSGTVSGFLLNNQRTDREALLAALKSAAMNQYYSEYLFVRTVNGGADCKFVEA